MPLRNLFYISKELQTKVNTEQLYQKKLVKIPTPRFLVFYNGTEKCPECQILRLSDSFIQPVEKPEMELVVTVLNINIGNNKELLEKCRILKEYVLYVEKVRKYAHMLPLQKAVEETVKECIEQNILRDFLRKNRKEAIAMSIYEYNEEQTLKYIREEEFQRGMDLGRQEGIDLGRMKGAVEMLRELGQEEGNIKEIIMRKYDLSEKEAEKYL